MVVSVGAETQSVTSPPLIEVATAVGTTPYSVNVNNSGESIINIPIDIPKGVNGMQPHLSLYFNSGGVSSTPDNQTSNGWLGFGWNLNGISHINRCTTNRPDIYVYKDPSNPVVGTQMPIRPWLAYDDTDSLCLDGQLLVLVSGTHFQPGAQYRTYTESFKLVTFKGTHDVPYFEVRNPNGNVSIYGQADNSHVRKTTTSGGTAKTPYFQWYVDSETDSFGNSISYTYGVPDESYSKQPNKTRIFPSIINYSGGRIEFGSKAKVTASTFHPGGTISDGPGVDQQRYYWDAGPQLASIIIRSVYGNTGAAGRHQGDLVYKINALSTQTTDSLAWSGVQVGSIQQCRLQMDYSQNIYSCLSPLSFAWKQTTSGLYPLWDANYLETITDGLGATTKFVYSKSPTDAVWTTQAYFYENPFDLPPNGSPWPISVNKTPATPSYTYYETSDSAADFVIVAVERSSGLGGADVRAIDYKYKGYSPQTRAARQKSRLGLGSLGFDIVRATDRTTGLVTYTQYSASSDYDEYRLQPKKLTNTFVFDGIFGQSGVNLLPKSESHPDFLAITQSNGSKTYLPILSQISSFKYEKGALVSATIKNNAYTITGGLITQIKNEVISGSQINTGATIPANFWGRSAIYTLNASSVTGTQVSTTTFGNSTSATDWRIGYKDTETVVSYNGGIGGTYTDTKTQTAKYVMKPSTMAVQSITRFQGDTENELITSYSYDTKGRQLTETVSGANVSSRTTTTDNYTDDSLNGLVVNAVTPKRITNALNHVTSLADFDLRSNQPETITDPNGLVTTQQFDSFGRLTMATDANGVSTTYTLQSCQVASCTSVSGKNGNITPTYVKEIDSPATPKTKEYYDSLGRVIRQETEGFNASEWIRVDTQYDTVGRIYKTSLPYKSSSSPQFTTNTYDILGRVTNVLRPDGGNISTVYDSINGSDGYPKQRTTLTETVKNSSSTVYATLQKISLVNSSGKPTQTTDAAGTTQAVSTSFQYDALGNISKTTVNGGTDGTTITTATYDNANNRTSIVDPNTGTVSMRYTALGQLRWMQDNKGNTTTYSYDLLGRLLSRTNIDGTSNWYYDPSGAKGMLSYSTNNNGYTQTYYYQDPDRLARLSRIETSISAPGLTARVYTQSITYDVYGRPKKSTSPSGFSATQNYNSYGYPSSIYRGDNSYQIQSAQQMGAFGNEQELFADGSTTTRTFDPKSGRMSTIKTTASNLNKVQDLTYLWRSNGSLESRTNSKSTSVVDTFNYDNLDRLTTTLTTSGVSQRTLTQAYNNLGNINSITSTNATDAQVTGYQYTSGRPHAISGATINGSYTALGYDLNGAITSYDAPGTAQDKYIAYNVANQPTNITLGASLTDSNPTARDEFRYTPDGARYYKKTTYKDGVNQRVEQTVYIGDYEATYFDALSSIKMSEKTQVGQSLLHILKTPYSGGTTEAQQVLHRDHLGSVDAVTEGVNTVASLAFEPFGSRRDASTLLGNASTAQVSILLVKNDVLNSQGYTGHETLDRTGIIHMKVGSMILS